MRRIPLERICDTAIGTHMLALSHLVRFLADAAGRIVVVGVQPACMGGSEGLSAAVEEGVAEVVRCVREGDVERIEVMR